MSEKTPLLEKEKLPTRNTINRLLLWTPPDGIILPVSARRWLWLFIVSATAFVGVNSILLKRLVNLFSDRPVGFCPGPRCGLVYPWPLFWYTFFVTQLNLFAFCVAFCIVAYLFNHNKLNYIVWGLYLLSVVFVPAAIISANTPPPPDL